MNRNSHAYYIGARERNRIKRKRRKRLILCLIIFFFLVLILSFLIFKVTKPRSNQNISNNNYYNYENIPVAKEPVSWNLILVNNWNRIPDNYEITLAELSNGHAVDERCYPALQEMMDACRDAGLTPVICSSYRSQEKQQELYSSKVNSLISQGYSESEAYEQAGDYYAIPGTSEHNLGLAVDIVDYDYQNLDSAQEDTAVQQWLMENCWKYGFILRYPIDKTEITGISYEPWHYRYVGLEAAQYIYENKICLEEYLD